MSNTDNYPLMMLYHTQLRNICNFTALAFSLLAISRFYREKMHKIYNISFILFSLLFFIISLFLIYFSKVNINKLKKDNKIINNWLLIYDIFFIINISIIIYILHIFYNQFDNKYVFGL